MTSIPGPDFGRVPADAVGIVLDTSGGDVRVYQSRPSGYTDTDLIEGGIPPTGFTTQGTQSRGGVGPAVSTGRP